MAVVIQFIWQVKGEVALTPQAIERLDPYITRYSQTMGVSVHAVGGTDDHIHVLFDLPLDKSVKSIETELRKTTTRFLRETLTLFGFSWADESTYISVTPDETSDVIAYIRENPRRHMVGDTISAWEAEEDAAAEEEALPEWLRSATKGS
jgi:putative transposase